MEENKIFRWCKIKTESYNKKRKILWNLIKTKRKYSIKIKESDDFKRSKQNKKIYKNIKETNQIQYNKIKQVRMRLLIKT